MEVEKNVPVVREEVSPPKEIIPVEVRDESRDAEHVKDEAVSSSPEFVVPLRDATVREGKEFSFECRLVGQPVPEIVWYKDGISILNNPDYLTTYVNGVCTLKIEETFAEDSAKYTCRAFNILGTAETSAMLTVEGKLYLSRRLARIF